MKHNSILIAEPTFLLQSIVPGSGYNGHGAVVTNADFPQPHMAGELLVRFEEGCEAAAAQQSAEKLAFAIKRQFKRFGWMHIALLEGMTVTGMGRNHFFWRSRQGNEAHSHRQVTTTSRLEARRRRIGNGT